MRLGLFPSMLVGGLIVRNTSGPTVSRATRFSIQVYYQPPGKKKVKRTKRVPVACCSCVLGEVLAKQELHKEKSESY